MKSYQEYISKTKIKGYLWEKKATDSINNLQQRNYSISVKNVNLISAYNDSIQKLNENINYQHNLVSDNINEINKHKSSNSQDISSLMGYKTKNLFEAYDILIKFYDNKDKESSNSINKLNMSYVNEKESFKVTEDLKQLVKIYKEKNVLTIRLKKVTDRILQIINTGDKEINKKLKGIDKPEEIEKILGI